MLIGVLFLMLGTLAAELSLFGFQVIALAGACFFTASAVAFTVVAVHRSRQVRPPRPAVARRPAMVSAKPSLSR